MGAPQSLENRLQKFTTGFDAEERRFFHDRPRHSRQRQSDSKGEHRQRQRMQAGVQAVDELRHRKMDDIDAVGIVRPTAMGLQRRDIQECQPNERLSCSDHAEEVGQHGVGHEHEERPKRDLQIADWLESRKSVHVHCLP